jgi:exopolysaccharide biosynthesis protein
MISETTGRNFNKYVTIAIMKDNTVRLYETDSTTTAEQKILRDLKNIKYAFSGTDVLIRNGGETEERAISKLEDDKDRPKTSVGFYNNNLMVAVTTAKTSQNWEKWGNTLRKINSNATWISMDGGGSSTIVIKGTPRQVAENVPNGRKVATIIGWYDV